MNPMTSILIRERRGRIGDTAKEGREMEGREIQAEDTKDGQPTPEG